MKSPVPPMPPPGATVEPKKGRHQFRVVGGISAAKESIPGGMPHTIKEVAVIASGLETFYITPISDIPLDGSAVKEEGYKVEQLRARIEHYLGFDAYVSDDLWFSVQLALEMGAKVVFELAAASVEIGDKMRRVVVRKGRKRNGQ